MMKHRVAIICGGRSSEHEISCISALGVLAAIDRKRFEPLLIGISKSGNWLQLEGPESFVKGEAGLISVPERAGEITFGLNEVRNSAGEKLVIDLFFPILHGAYGEDGTVQGLFEMIDIPYVGSGVLASSVAMDKSVAKLIFADFGLRVAEGETIHQREWKHDPVSVRERISSLGLPIFIKPARSGSSRGTSKVKRIEEIDRALASAFEHDPRALVEKAVIGREIECAVLEVGGVASASVLGEIKVDQAHEFYDFEAKYLDGSTTFEYPARISDEMTARIKTSAITAFNALGCEGLARVDFFLTEDDLVINELNTMPGFTPRSVFPMLWGASGKSYEELITTLCESALQRPRNVIR